MNERSWSPDQQAAYARRQMRYWDLGWLLDQTEREARATIQAGKEPKAAEDAEVALAWLESLRGRVDGDNREVVTLALKLGALAERMGFRVLEPHAKRSLRALMALRAAAEKRAHPPEAIAKALARYDRLLAENPKRKKRAAQEQVARETGISDRTLRDHLSKRSR